MKAATPVNGSDTFPNTTTDVCTLIETLAVQEIRNVKSANRIDDGLYYYDLTDSDGVVIEQAVINKATKRVFDKTKCDMSPLDPSLAVRYFNNFETRQYKVTVRRDDIRKIIANKGVGVEDVVAEILDTLTQGRDSDDFKSSRSLIMNTEGLTDYRYTLAGVPANMEGVLYAIRDMYETLRDENSGYNFTMYETATPEKDIRIAISSKLMNLLDVTTLANIFNLSKVELMGKLVVIPVSDLTRANWYKVVVYDRMAFNRARRINDITFDECASGRYVNYFLTVEDAFFYSPLFKVVELDVSAAATAKYNSIITGLQVEPQDNNL